MKLSFKLGIILLVISRLSFADQDKTASSNIQKVTVYRQQAEVFRKASTTIGSGYTEVVLSGLSDKVDANSIRLSGSGDATILSVQYRKNYLSKQEQSPEEQRLNALIEGKMDEIIQVKNELDVYNGEINLMNSNRTVGGANVGLNWENLENVADLYRERMLSLKKIVFERQKSKQNLDKELADLQKQLNQVRANRNKPSGEIMVAMQSSKSQNVVFDFSYLVNGAGWVPNYDIKSFDGKDEVEILFKANVYQSTGIDWKQLPISVSTSNPSQGGVKPTLHPWYIQEMQNISYNQKGYGDVRSSAMPKRSVQNIAQEEVLYSADESAPGMGNVAQYAVVDQSMLATSYSSPFKQNVPSDGQYHIISIKDYSVKSYLEHAAVPKIDQDAFLLAYLLDWEQYNFLPGEANVFFDGTFAGKTYFNPAQAIDTLELSLGRDKKIQIERKIIKDFNKTKTFGLNIKKQVGYEIIIKNTKSIPVTINLQDQLPVSKHEQIVVTSVETDKATIDPNTGFMDWKLKIKPGDTERITIKFEVKYPKKMKVSGI